MAEGEGPKTGRRGFLGLLGGLGLAALVGQGSAPSGEAREVEQTLVLARDEDLVGEYERDVFEPVFKPSGSHKSLTTNPSQHGEYETPASGETGFRVTSTGVGWAGPTSQEGHQFYTQGKDVSVENLFVAPQLLTGKDGRKAIKVIVDSAVQFKPLSVDPEKASFWVKDTQGNLVASKELIGSQPKSWQADNGSFFIPLDGNPGVTAGNVVPTMQFESIGSFGVDFTDPGKSISFVGTKEVVK